VLDRRFLPDYCHHLAKAHAAADQFAFAAADHVLALTLNPKDPRAPRWRSEFEQALRYAAEQASERNKKSTVPRVVVRPSVDNGTTKQRAVGSANVATEKHAPLATAPAIQVQADTPPASGPTAFEREQQLLQQRELERQMELRKRLEQAQAEKKLEEKRRAEAKKKRRRPKEEDDEDRLPLWKKGVLVAGALAMVLWLGPMAWGWMQDRRAQIGLTARRVSQEFAADYEQARLKYAGNYFALSGQLKVEETARGPRVLFDVPAEGGYEIECQFATQAERLSVRTGADVTIVGDCSLRKDGPKTRIVLVDCTLQSPS
jgi:hypothetical protein